MAASSAGDGAAGGCAVVARQQRAGDKDRYPQGQVEAAAGLILGLDGIEVHHEHIQQPDRDGQAHPAKQVAREHQPGPLVRGQDQVDDEQLRIQRREAGQPEERRVHTCLTGRGAMLPPNASGPGPSLAPDPGSRVPVLLPGSRAGSTPVVPTIRLSSPATTSCRQAGVLLPIPRSRECLRLPLCRTPVTRPGRRAPAPAGAGLLSAGRTRHAGRAEISGLACRGVRLACRRRAHTVPVGRLLRSWRKEGLSCRWLKTSESQLAPAIASATVLKILITLSAPVSLKIRCT